MVINAIYRRSQTIKTQPVYLYNTGVKVKILNAPSDPYRVEFANGQTATVIDDVASIPDEQFTSMGDVELYVVVIDGKAVNTLCKIVIPLEWRPARGSVSTDNVSDSGG